MVACGGLLLVEQPGVQRIALLAQGRAPGQHQQQLGPGGSDIGKSLPLLQLGPKLLLAGALARAPVVVQVQVEHGFGLPAFRAARVPAHADGLAAAALSAGLPKVGTDHHWIFQALAAVHRQHRYGLIHHVAVGLVGVGDVPVGIETQTPQPVGCRCGTQLVGMEPHGHQFTALLQIRQQPAAEG